MRVLVVEDETKVGSFIKRALEEESYAVDLCEDGAQGLDQALTGSYDLIMIDLMLPGLPGMEVLTRLRKEKIQTPVLILTAQSKVDQRVKGLDAGADDYLTKPFAIDELLARVRAFLRRGTAETSGTVADEDLWVQLPYRALEQVCRDIGATYFDVTVGDSFKLSQISGACRKDLEDAKAAVLERFGTVGVVDGDGASDGISTIDLNYLADELELV